MKKLLNSTLAGVILLGSCGAKRDTLTQTAQVVHPKDTVSTQALVYQTYGLPELYHDQALRYVLRRFGVEVKSVAGCVVTDSLVNNVAKNNEALFAVLSKRSGADAKGRILNEVNSRAAMQQKLEDCLRKDPGVLKKEQALNSKPEEGSIAFGVFEDGGKGRFQIAADLLRYKDGEWVRTPWKHFSIDTQRKVVTTVD